MATRGFMNSVDLISLLKPWWWNEKWHPLFTADELSRARTRLKKYGYVPKV
jgi:hypothetical protein